MLIAVRVHPFPFRTRKLSSLALKILGGQLPGKISRCQHSAHLAQSVEHAAVNRRVVGSSPTVGAKRKTTQSGGFFVWHLLYALNPVTLCFGRRIAAVNWLAAFRRRWRTQERRKLDETGRMPKRAKRGRRPGLHPDRVVGRISPNE